MPTPPVINTAWHPLASGNPPAWASEWGQDRHGVFVAFTIEKVTQRLRWIRGLKSNGTETYAKPTSMENRRFWP
jgi:hypothetical protein